MKVKKAIITAAGYGTRFLPATKNIPKEMLPLVDVPIIHETVKECIEAGIEQIIIVTRHGNNAIEDYFDNNKALEDYLKETGKYARYERFHEVFDKAEIAYVRQHRNMPYGTGTPVLAAKPFLTKGEPFAVLFGDDVVLSKNSAIGQLKRYYEEMFESNNNVGGVIAAQKVQPEVTNRYGMVKFKDEARMIMDHLIEKPKTEESPSLFATYGRYILDYQLFDYLHPENTGKDGELWLADAIDKLCQQKDVFAHQVEGTWMTTGDPLNYLETVLAFAMKRDDLKDGLEKIMAKFVVKD